MFLFTKIQYQAQEKPYRLLTSLNEQTQKIEIIDNGSVLYVDAETKLWVDTLQQEAVRNGWRAGDYLIDFTGGSPGSVVVLNGKAPGAAWFLGNYSGSDEYVLKILSHVDNDIIRKAWLLIAPDGKRKISEEVLAGLNIDLKRYVKIVEVETGYRHETQELWKPVQ